MKTNAPNARDINNDVPGIRYHLPLPLLSLKSADGINYSSLSMGNEPLAAPSLGCA